MKTVNIISSEEEEEEQVHSHEATMGPSKEFYLTSDLELASDRPHMRKFVLHEPLKGGDIIYFDERALAKSQRTDASPVKARKKTRARVVTEIDHNVSDELVSTKPKIRSAKPSSSNAIVESSSSEDLPAPSTPKQKSTPQKSRKRTYSLRGQSAPEYDHNDLPDSAKKKKSKKRQDVYSEESDEEIIIRKKSQPTSIIEELESSTEEDDVKVFRKRTKKSNRGRSLRGSVPEFDQDDLPDSDDVSANEDTTQAIDFDQLSEISNDIKNRMPVFTAQGESEVELEYESEESDMDPGPQSFRGNYLWCSYCGKLKNQDDFSVREQNDPRGGEERRFCLLHTWAGLGVKYYPPPIHSKVGLSLRNDHSKGEDLDEFVVDG